MSSTLTARLVAGTPAKRSAKQALFVGGFATFAMFYGPQLRAGGQVARD